MKKSGKFGIIKLLCLCFVVAIVSAVPTLATLQNKRGGLEDNLKGNTSEFQGVLTIWNVDSFESGSQSKTVFLEEASRRFSSDNKGLYFLIENLSVEEMMQNFMNEIFPDIISFGMGVGKVVLPILENLNGLNVNAVRKEVLDSGINSDNLMALGYLMGGYILASTNEKLATAGVGGEVKLTTVLNTAGFDTETKKGTKHTSSVVVGENSYIRPELVSEVALGLTLEDKFISPTMFDAYADFVGYNKGTILLGTHRDLFKLSGRIKVGKISGVKIEYINSYTNLIQYVGVVKGADEVRMALSKKFVEYLASNEAQQISTKVGMMNVIGQKFYESGEFQCMEEALSGRVIIPNLFEN